MLEAPARVMIGGAGVSRAGFPDLAGWASRTPLGRLWHPLGDSHASFPAVVKAAFYPRRPPMESLFQAVRKAVRPAKTIVRLNYRCPPCVRSVHVVHRCERAKEVGRATVGATTKDIARRSR